MLRRVPIKRLLGGLVAEVSKICELFKIEHPIVQAGMIWVSGAKLAAAAANTGCLGIIGAGSMKPDVLRAQIRKAHELTTGSLGINLPLLYHGASDQIETALDEGIKIFITSAGSPKKFTPHLQERGAVVVHVTASPVLAKKCEAAGVDAVVVEGFEAGGHNGREELTTMVAIPAARNAVSIPIIAAGGIANGRQVAAALALGADGVQIGSRFAATQESSAHENFKNAIVGADADATRLVMKNLVPVRLLRNKFFDQVVELESKAADADQLAALLGKGRAKRGMHDGELDEGELEIGQVAALIDDLPSCTQLVETIVNDYRQTLARLPKHI